MLVNAIVLLVAGVLVAIVAVAYRRTGAALGVVAATLFGFYALVRLTHMTTLPGPLIRVMNRYKKYF